MPVVFVEVGARLWEDHDRTGMVRYSKACLEESGRRWKWRKALRACEPNTYRRGKGQGSISGGPNLLLSVERSVFTGQNRGHGGYEGGRNICGPTGTLTWQG